MRLIFKYLELAVKLLPRRAIYKIAQVIMTVSQQTQNICITFVQRRPDFFDVGPPVYKCYTNVLSLLGYAYCHLCFCTKVHYYRYNTHLELSPIAMPKIESQDDLKNPFNS